MGRSFALARTPMYDAQGNMNRSWVRYFANLASDPAYIPLTPDGGGNVTVDLTLGQNDSAYQITLTGAALTFIAPAGATAGALFRLYIDQDSTGNRPFPTFATGAGGFASDANSEQPMLTASTRTAFSFSCHTNGSNLIWTIDSFRTNAAIS